MNIIEYFDDVRIINVASRKDRYDDTVSEFKHHGLKINTDKVRFFEAVTPKENAGFPNAGVRGCFLSHLGVLEEADRASFKNVLVLEDDIQFSKKISEYGNLAIEQLSNIDWDIIYFGHAVEDTKGEVAWKKVNQPMLLAHFYAVNGRALKRLIKSLHQIMERPPGHPDGGPMHYDGALNTFMRQNDDIKAYYYSFNLGYQRASKTDLHELSIFDTNIILRPIVRVVRKIKSKLQRNIR
jgi:hypothetical protein